MKDLINVQLRHQQIGFRKDRSYTDQIAILRIVVEQFVVRRRKEVGNELSANITSWYGTCSPREQDVKIFD
ncbi:unnamed protein product [Schistosoma mattheei]|uniref:Uncharacterized protein n=1 Tax=Schistosoma mattheei TaxID=31246 RepID=A0A183NGK0_9TREM|nr:unnamed protein product [Schistosoma mattheei]